MSKRPSAKFGHAENQSIQPSQETAAITEACARIIAEEGEQDYARATRKAIARLGLPDGTRQPRYADITLALNRYLALFQADSQPTALRRLRLEARSILRLLETTLPDSAPVLTGAVALGHANAFSAIEIALFVDDFKTFDFFLFDHDIETRIEADGNYHGDANTLRGNKNNQVIYHVLHTACDVRFKPILQAYNAQKFASNDASRRPKIGHLQASFSAENQALPTIQTAKSPMTLWELEALLASESTT